MLCYSRLMYVEFTVSQTMEHFLGCHLNAFEFFAARIPARIMPEILNHDELVRLFTVTTNPKHRALLMTAYAAGLRANELGRLQVADIDSARMCLRVDQGSGQHNPAVLARRMYSPTVEGEA